MITTVCLLCLFSVVPLSMGQIKARIRFMTFNTWVYGTQVSFGLEKIAKHINIVQPNVVALQEMEQYRIDALLPKLTGTWYQCNYGPAVPNRPFIISRFPMLHQYTPVFSIRDVGCKLAIDPNDPTLFINVWDVHLNAGDYSPYKACFEPPRADIRSVMMGMERDYVEGLSSKRCNEMMSLIANSQFIECMKNANEEPLFLAGDFNAPSHLDWIESTKSDHCNVAFEWPTTKLLEDNGFLDSYRVMHPDPVADPGVTWTVVYTYNDPPFNTKIEPKDRIDFIFYKSSRLVVTSSWVYFGSIKLSEVPNQALNDWPSDHASVVTDFDLY